MANNRIFLCYRPTGRAIMLGKRMLGGYYHVPTEKDFELFFDACEKDWIENDDSTERDLDDFVLLDEMEKDVLEKAAKTIEKYINENKEKMYDRLCLEAMKSTKNGHYTHVKK